MRWAARSTRLTRPRGRFALRACSTVATSGNQRGRTPQRGTENRYGKSDAFVSVATETYGHGRVMRSAGARESRVRRVRSCAAWREAAGAFGGHGDPASHGPHAGNAPREHNHGRPGRERLEIRTEIARGRGGAGSERGVRTV